MKKTFYIVTLFVILSCNLFSQAGLSSYGFGTIKEIDYLSTKDTLVTNRSLGKWWFGLSCGYDGLMSIGTLRVPRISERPLEFLTDDDFITFPSSFGNGFHIGLYGEWRPIESDFGVFLKLLYDNRNNSSKTEPSIDSLQTFYEHRLIQSFISFSLDANYRLPIEGLNLFGGIDFDILINHDSKLRKEFINTGRIDQFHPDSSRGVKSRLGINIGISYDFYTLDIYRGLRVFLSPYLSVHAGSNIFTDFNSSLNNIFARLGVTVKSGFDEKKYDTLKFNPNYKEPPKAIVRINEQGVSVPQRTPFVASSLGINDFSLLENIAPVTAQTPTVEVTEKVSQTEVTEKKKYTFKIGEEKVFNYPTSSATSLSKEMRDYLDELAEFIKSNPNVRVRIQGHSDGTGGTPEINMKRSEDRANAINRYLISKNIPQSKLFPVGYGNTKPIASERTEEGRRMNRRVEIIIER